MGEDKSKYELPKVDLSRAGQAGPGSEAWATVQAKMTQALLNYGGFEAVYDVIDPELQDDLLSRAMPEAFMADARFSTAPSLPSNGWFLRMTGFAFKSLQITDPKSLKHVEEYARTIWPHGNDFFCNTICKYATHMEGLVQIIYSMIFKSLDLEHHLDSHMKSVAYSMRLSEYFKDVTDDGTQTGMPPHVDTNYLSIIFQHEVAGLEVEAPNGEWICIPPRQDSFVVLLGASFMAWTNGRFRAPSHRVRVDGTKKRYSVIFCSFPSREDEMVKTMDELVDNEHPLVYKPFKYYDYLNFHFGNGEITDDLKTYCGVEQPRAAA